MYSWLKAWFKELNDLKTSWLLLPESIREKRLQALETSAAELLDVWTVLDDYIHALKEDEQTFHSMNYESLGTIYYDLSMYEKAAKSLETEKTTGVLDEVRRLYLGFAYVFIEADSQAKEQFLYLLKTSRVPLIRHFSCVGLGCLYAQVNQFDEAIHFFERAKRITETTDVMYNLGVCFFATCMFSIAKQYFQTYVASNRDDSEALFFLGCCYYHDGEKEKAWSCWLASLQQDVTAELLLALAYVFEWTGNHEMAINCYKQLQAMRYADVDIFHGLAWNYALLENEEKAIDAFQKALAIDPDNDQVAQSLSWLERHWPEANWSELLLRSRPN